MSLSSERDRIQRQVEELEKSLSVTQTELDLLSSDTGDELDDEGMEDEMGQSAAGLLAQREKIQKEIENLQDFLGQHSSICVSDDEDSSSSDESDLGLSATPNSCLQLNLVYQQVLQETLDQLMTLLTQNRRQQRELITQMSGPIKAPPRDQPPRSSYQLPAKMFLGRFLKPYFKDKLTGLGPPANQEGKQRVLRMTGCLDDKRLKPKRWESWQKTLLIHSVARDSLKRLMQPKLSRVDYLTQKLSSASEAERQQLRENINALEKEIDLLRQKKEEELVGDRYEEHDWQKISNIDFEGTKYAEDIRLFWQNFLHPSINKSSWTKEEVQQLKEVSRSHQEMHWEDIAEELGTGRTAFMCLQMFQRFVSSSLKRGSWSPDEDILLRELVDKMRIGNFIPYTQMSYFMEGRDPTQLIYRWNQVLDPSLKKGPWSKEEDQLLLQAVARHGEKWWKVRLEVPGRTDSACRDRYLDCLRMDLKKGPFDKQEQELLQALVEKHGVGRWSKIASEIPHRQDAQCMREWRKLSRPHQLRKRKTMRGREKKEGNRRRLRKRLVQIKEKELTEEEEEEEDSVVPYMDSDEDEEKRKRQRKKVVKNTETLVKEKDKLQEEEEEEEEEEYILPPIQNWLSSQTLLTPPSLNFCPAMLPSFSESGSGDAVRSTILAKSGRSVIIGPRPRELRWEERHSSGAMMMASHDQLRAHCSRLVLKLRNPGGRSRTGPGSQTVCNRVTEYELQAAITPWVGHLLVASTARRTVADNIKETGELRGVSSTAVFLLLLQVMNVDTHGCKDTIESRKKKAKSQAPPPPVVTVAGLLQQRRTMMQQEGEDQEQRRQLLLQLEEVQAERRKNRERRLLVQVSQPHPHLLFQVPPQVTPVLLRQPLLPPPPSQFIPPPSLNTPLSAPIRALLPRAYATSPPAPPITGVSNTTPTSHPSHQPPLSNSWGVVTGVGEANMNMGGANTGVGGGGDTEYRRILEQIQAKAAVQEGETSTSSCSNQVASIADGLNLAPPPSTVTMELPGPSLRDHDYTRLSPGPSRQSAAPQKSGSASGRAPNGRSPKCPAKERKRAREKEEQEEAVERSHAEQTADGSGTGVVQDGKRLRRPSLKARALQEHKQAQLRHRQAEVKRSASSSPRKRPRKGCLQDAVATQTPPPPPTMCLTPGQTMWVMTTAGLVQLAPAPPPGMVQLTQAPPSGLALIQSSPLPPQPEISPQMFLTLPPHTAALPVRNPSAILTLPYRGVVKVDSAKAPLLRREALQFDPSLIFPEPLEAVRDWLSGRGGVVVPGARVALPYMPPFVGSLSTLTALLRSMKSLKMTSLQLLDPPRCRPKPTHQTRARADQPELADSIVNPPGDTSDLPTADPLGDPSELPTTDPLEEEQVKAVRRLVAERFSTNPAYQLLKARFLSCFTVPALLATIQPVATEMMTRLTNEEEEEEEEEELRRIEKRGRRRRTERSLLLSEGCGAPANHFSGIRNADKNATNQTTQDQ